ncbi:MAG TPA: hypothetical protein VGV87_30595 [Blastocatellia bacterium]|nr:hypothetical protein [Blastocatellia bacterium]
MTALSVWSRTTTTIVRRDGTLLAFLVERDTNTFGGGVADNQKGRV